MGRFLRSRGGGGRTLRREGEREAIRKSNHNAGKMSLSNAGEMFFFRREKGTRKDPILFF